MCIGAIKENKFKIYNIRKKYEFIATIFEKKLGRVEILRHCSYAQRRSQKFATGGGQNYPQKTRNLFFAPMLP